MIYSNNEPEISNRLTDSQAGFSRFLHHPRLLFGHRLKYLGFLLIPSNSLQLGVNKIIEEVLEMVHHLRAHSILLAVFSSSLQRLLMLSQKFC